MKTILIVDDKAIIRELVETALRGEGYRTVSACGGADAITMLASEVPELVLLDLCMPSVDGLGVLTRMRSTPSLGKVPVIVLTSAGDRATVTQVARLGVSGFILKDSFSLPGLLKKVAEVLAPGTPAVGPASQVAARSLAPTPPRRAVTSSPTIRPPSAAGGAFTSDGRSATEALKSLPSIMSRPQLLARIDKCGELQGLSPAVAQVMKLTANSHTSCEALAKAIGQDQAIAVKILKLANSSVYTRGKPVDSVQTAVVRIGLERIRQAVINLSVVDRFSAVAFDRHLETRQFWEHAIACGIIAAEIAHATDAKHADGAFTAGLMHDVGRVVLAEQLGAAYVEVISMAQALQLPLETVETRMLGATHAEIMERVLLRWGFPKGLVKPIVLHHSSAGVIRTTAPEQVVEAARLALANRLAHALLLGTSGNETIYPTEELCQAVGLSPATFQHLIGLAQQQTDDMKFAMLSNSSGSAWPRRVEQVRAGLRAPFRPLFVSASPDTDAFRVFIQQMAEADTGEPPNVAVVHLARDEDKLGLLEQLRAAQAARGLSNAPCVVLTPPGRSAPLPSATGRFWRHLTTPVTVSAFVDAVNAAIAPAAGRNAA
ncbi:Sporulation initiation phosphotransferase F [Phycisphaerales bacterium]|nr:Sporulation initiation phosphotransferase F [Phycisphaerales bacterium]